MTVLSQIKCIMCLLKFSKCLYYVKKCVCVITVAMTAVLLLGAISSGKLSMSKVKGWLA